MSVKFYLQVLILLLIATIIGVTYSKYFKISETVNENNDLSKIDNSEKIDQLQNKITLLELKNEELKNKFPKDKKKSKKDTKDNEINVSKSKLKKEVNIEKGSLENETILKKEKIINLVRDIKYTSIDQKGNKFLLLATSGKSNKDNKDVLDLVNVRGEIRSSQRDTIYIKSEYAKYNASNLNSNFYKNVIINYQNKKITCENFYIHMETNKALAYNNVVVTDPISVMKAGMIEFDLKTKDININPEKSITKIEVLTNNGSN